MQWKKTHKQTWPTPFDAVKGQIDFSAITARPTETAADQAGDFVNAVKLRLSIWLLFFCCLAAFTVLVVGPRIGAPAPQQHEPAAPELVQNEEIAELTESEAPAPRALEPGQSSRARQVVPRPDQTQPLPQQVGRLAAENSAIQSQGQTLSQARRAPVSDFTPSPGAEVLSYAPSLQKLAVTNFVRSMEKLRDATTESERYLVLDGAAKLAFMFGKTEDARAYAAELLSLDRQFQAEPWRGGDAVHDGNLVLGRIAVQEGQLEEAKQYLLDAGKSTGSPVLDSFGPNMSLARDLLAAGQRDTVLQYFELCRNFWNDGQKLTQWTAEVRAGLTPDFGANLVY